MEKGIPVSCRPVLCGHGLWWETCSVWERTYGPSSKHGTASVGIFSGQHKNCISLTLILGKLLTMHSMLFIYDDDIHNDVKDDDVDDDAMIVIKS